MSRRTHRPIQGDFLSSFGDGIVGSGEVGFTPAWESPAASANPVIVCNSKNQVVALSESVGILVKLMKLFRCGFVRWLVVLFGVPIPISVRAQPVVPFEVGTLVAGYQDDFSGTTLQSDWTPTGTATGVYAVSDGVLHVTTANGDPNHLLYARSGYDATTQEILARLRVLQFGTGDPARGGVGVGVDPNGSTGINFHFRDGPLEGVSGRHLSFLDDFRAWGPALSFAWQTNVWYWVRLRQEPNAASLGGVKDVFAKVWAADGVTAEPPVWQTWDYIPSRSIRSGLAGITAGSSAGTSVFDVDYVLIKAAGLPQITVAPAAFPLFKAGPVSITLQPTNQTAEACSSATFQVAVDGTPPYQFQWYQNEVPLAGATNDALTLPSLRLADDGTVLKVVVSNVAHLIPYTVMSRAVTVHVALDPTPPSLLSAQSEGGLNTVRLLFSKALSEASATNIAHYQVTNSTLSLPILSAAVQSSGRAVVLTTRGQLEGLTYTLTVNNLLDACTESLQIAQNTQTTFVSRTYTPVDIGSSTPAGSITAVSGGYHLRGGGIGVLGSSDQFQYSAQIRAGDFDVQVQLTALVGPDVWSEAGLMVRDSLSPGSRCAFVLATPGISGSSFKYRPTDGATLVQTGSYPVNYPDTWLRLKRTGNTLTGYASRDSQTWTPLGSTSWALSANLYLGYAISGHNSSNLAEAAFREFSDVPTSAIISTSGPSLAALGQSNRKTGLVLSEVMYHPSAHFEGPETLPTGDPTNHLEFVELFNSQSVAEDLGNYRLDGDVHYTFPEGTVIPGGGFLVIAKQPADLQRVYSISGILGPYTGTLPNSSGKVQLRNPIGAVFLEVNYDSRPPWPASPDGGGHSLVLVRPSLGEGDVQAWAASDAVGGSPGRLDPIGVEPLRALVINEFIAHSETGSGDFIELYNHSNKILDLSGCSLSDDPETNRFIIPSGTLLSPRSHLAFDQSTLGFGLKAAGGTLYLRNPARTRILDAIRYEAQADQIAFGRCPDGAPTWRSLSASTPGSANASRSISEVVINEILYNPISGLDEDQFVELYNRSANPMDISGWKLVAGISFTIPDNIRLQPGEYLVIAHNLQRMRTNDPGLTESNSLGNFLGTLAHGGERLALARPELLIQTSESGNGLVTNQLYVVVSEVSYQTGGRWGKWSARGGSSLELIHPDADPLWAGSWADSDETSKAPWTTVSATGTMDNGNVPADSLQILLQSTGECLVDNVEVLNAAKVNLVANGTFETGATGWFAEGTMDQSSLTTIEGYQSAHSFQLRAVDRGDNQLNRVRTALKSSPAANTQVTLQAKMRWLRGSPNVLMRLRGNWLEAPGNLALPTNPGTPGAKNSRWKDSAPPAIHDVVHSPVLPADRQPVQITARVSSFTDRPNIRLNYRLDPSPTYRTMSMVDDGTSGDEVAGDGIYTGTIPGQATGVLVAFFLEATDGTVASSVAKFPADGAGGDALVRFGEIQPTGNLPTYRLWMTQANFNTWSSRNKLNNTPLDCTFVIGNQRVIYNTVALYAGSPYIAPGYCGPDCGRCGYSITFPDDDRFLGSADLVLDWAGGHGGETTALQEQMAYWMAGKMGLPTCHRYPIRLHVNGVTDDQRNVLFEAVNQPAAEFIKAWSPGDHNGDFYKVDRGFEFSDGGGLTADPMPTLQVFNTSGGVKKKARYRWNWSKRADDDPNNYTNIFNLVDAVNAVGPEPYTTRTEALVDVEEWMGIFAVEHIINNFDSWGHDIGKNMYAYKPQQGKWQIYMFDLDWLMLAATGYSSSFSAKLGPLFNCSDPVISRMYSHPPFRRAYFRAIQAAVEGPLVASNCDPLMDAKYASYVANGIRFCDGQSLSAPAAVKTWFRERRTALQAQLAAVAANFTLIGPTLLTSSVSPVQIKGTAPIQMKALSVNGIEVPLTWTTLTNWTASIPLVQATNVLALTGVDRQGMPLTGSSATVTVIYRGASIEPVRVWVNEWMAANSSTIADVGGAVAQYDDWFELYNPGGSPVDLRGYYLTDTLSNPDQFQIPGGYIIPSHGYLLVWADNEPQQNSAGQPDLHVNFQLSAKGEAIGLFAPDGTAVDTVSFGPQLPDISEGRCPDGGPVIGPMPVATPRLSNHCDSAPVAPRLDWAKGLENQLVLRWETSPGWGYWVEFSETLKKGDWSIFGSKTTANGAELTQAVPIEQTEHRYFRVRTAR